MIRSLGSILLQLTRVVLGMGAAYFLALMTFPAVKPLDPAGYLILAAVLVFLFIVMDTEGRAWFENMTFSFDHFESKALVATFYFLSIPTMWLALQQSWLPDVVCGVMISAMCVAFGMFYQQYVGRTELRPSY